MYTGNVHHFIASGWSLSTLFNSDCRPSIDGMPLDNHDACLLQVDPCQVYIMTFILGFMLYEIMLYLLFLDQSKPLIKQTIWHHEAVILLLTLGLYIGYSAPKIAALMAVGELSSVFGGYRIAIE